MEASGYVRQADSLIASSPNKKKSLHPAVGDVVRYYDVDGGNSKGQVLVGRISFIQKNLGREGSGWSVEISELDNVGSGYYTDYPFQQRRSKKTMRDLAGISPVAASFVRAEDAFKVPMEAGKDTPLVRAEMYDIEDYDGPFAGANAINLSVVEADAVIYDTIKSKLLRYTALAGLGGAIVADWVKGPEDAVIYAAGAAASLVYLYFLTVKTDTVASPQAKLGKGVANLRFAMPLLVLVGVALYNQSRGADNPVLDNNSIFTSVTAEQFGAVILGFLTYRIPLFLTQIQEAFAKDENGNVVLPGSVGMAMQLASKPSTQQTTASSSSVSATSNLPTILLVSGPQATGRPDLVNRLVAAGEGTFIQPAMVDRVQDAIKFEQLDQRDEFLYVDTSERYGLTKESILKATRLCGPNSVVVVDADVALAKKMTKIGGIRLIGVWVALNSVAEFEKRLDALIDSGALLVLADEDRASVKRARIRDIVQEIEFGISSGIFEFTIINQDDEDSLRQLKEASAYCFKK